MKLESRKELKKLHTKRVNNPIYKWANELNDHFSNEEKHMAINT
jgi:hypothetical protein